jgi:nucleotide-binding universal stress UspA family protein
LAKKPPRIVKGRKMTLLVAVDFSPASRIAMEAAGGLAKDLGLQVVLLHATSPYATPPKPKGGKRSAAALVEPASADAQRLTTEWAAALRKDGVDVDSIIREDWPAKAILEEAETLRPVAIVIGTAGRGPLKEFLLGSVAQEILRRSKVPVLVAPARMARASKADPSAPVGKLLLAPVDFSTDSERSFQAALGLAKDLKCLVRALHVIPLPTPAVPVPYSGVEYSMGWLEKDEEKAAEELAQLASQAKRSSVGVVPSLQLGHPVWVILAEARQAGAAMIVMGTHGKSASRRFLLGSTAQAVVQLADRPVLVVPDPKGPDAGDWKR